MSRFDQLILNATLATMQTDLAEPYGLIKNGALGIKNGLIAYVGPADGLSDVPDALCHAVTDAEERLITPGLIDCHTHLIYGGSRATEWEARLNGVSYETIASQGGGILSTVNATREASEQALFASARIRLDSMMQQGVTVVEIKSGYGLNLQTERKMLRVAKRLGNELPITIRTTFLGAHALPPEYANDKDGYIDHLCREMLPALAKEGLIDAVDGFCEAIGFSPAQITRLFDAATELNLPVKLHAEQLSDQGGAALAASYSALSADHLEYVTKDGIKAMAECDTTAVLLPGAFYFLKETNLPPIDLFRKHNVPMAVATDCNPGTSPFTNLRLMMNMACTVFGLTPEEALRGTTINAARALGMAETHGSLELNKQADVVMWECAHPAELIYSPDTLLNPARLDSV